MIAHDCPLKAFGLQAIHLSSYSFSIYCGVLTLGNYVPYPLNDSLLTGFWGVGVETTNPENFPWVDRYTPDFDRHRHYLSVRRTARICTRATKARETQPVPGYMDGSILNC